MYTIDQPFSVRVHRNHGVPSEIARVSLNFKKCDRAVFPLTTKVRRHIANDHQYMGAVLTMAVIVKGTFPTDHQ